MEIRLAIIPSESVSAKIGNLGRRLGKKFPHYFMVDNRKLFPHATLFKLDIKKRDYPKLLEVVKTITAQMPKFSIRANKFGIMPGGWLDLEINSSQKIIRMRKNLLKEIKKIGVADMTIKIRYRPHITLTRFRKEKHAFLSIDKEPAPKMTIPVKGIGLCLSRQTQVYKVLDIYKVK